MAGVDWGSVGDWVSGCGALVAVGATVMMWLRDRRDRLAAEEKLRNREDSDAEQARTAQARSVHLWARYSASGKERFLFLWNGSNTPVNDVCATIARDDEAGSITVTEPDLLPTPIRPYRISIEQQLGQAHCPRTARLSVTEARFRDDRSQHWLIDANHNRTEVPANG